MFVLKVGYYAMLAPSRKKNQQTTTTTFKLREKRRKRKTPHLHTEICVRKD